MTDQPPIPPVWPIEEAIAYEGKDRIVHFTDYLEIKKSALVGRKSFQSHFGSFDKATGGLRTGQVVVISGHRKEGKTTFAESWIRSMASVDAEAKAVVLSYEMPPEELLLKWKGDPNMPLYLPLELEAGNFEWILKKCLEAKYKFNANIVMIDHLGFVVDMATKNASFNIGAFMRRLKLEVALRHNMAVILIVHQKQVDENKEASVDSLFGSVTIGQDSDATIIVLRRDNLNKTELQDFVMKAGEHKLHLVTPPALADPDDPSSAGLAIVKVDCHRVTGVRKWKKMFRKNGDWMDEI